MDINIDLDPDPNVAYVWYHTQNNDGKRYVNRYGGISAFRTRYECLDDINNFRNNLADGEEKRLTITYVIEYFVNAKIRENGMFDCGMRVSTEIISPLTFDNIQKQ